MCLYSKVIPIIRTDDVTPISKKPPNTELLKHLDGVKTKIHKAVQFQNHISSVTFLVIIDDKLYCFISDMVNINTTRIKPNVCTCMCYTEAGNVTDLICQSHESYTMTNLCIPHNQYMKGHDTLASFCYIDTGNDSSKVNDPVCYGHRYTMTNPCVPHSKYMRDHDTYDDIRGGK